MVVLKLKVLTSPKKITVTGDLIALPEEYCGRRDIRRFKKKEVHCLFEAGRMDPVEKEIYVLVDV